MLGRRPVSPEVSVPSPVSSAGSGPAASPVRISSSETTRAPVADGVAATNRAFTGGFLEACARFMADALYMKPSGRT